MSNKEKSTEDAESLRFENEFLKAKIAAEYGGVHGNATGETPPEIENAFLNHVLRFEETMKNAKEILIYDFIGRPEFKKELDLSDEQLPKELDRVVELLEDYDIVCDTICEVDDRSLYKFLTEELFQLTTLDKRVAGMVAHFIYEDFHPDHEYDTRMRCEEFLNLFFGDGFHKHIQNFFPEDNRNLVEICEFHDCFHEFRNVEFEVRTIEVNPGECTRTGTLSFDAVTSLGTKPIHYEGEATFELEYKYDWWVVVSAVLPGMVGTKN